MKNDLVGKYICKEYFYYFFYYLFKIGDHATSASDNESKLALLLDCREPVSCYR